MIKAKSQICLWKLMECLKKHKLKEKKYLFDLLLDWLID
jgi:hypothetical protein